MTKCEVIDVTLSDSDSDGDFIQAKKVIHPFLYQVSVVHQVSITSSFYYIKFLLQLTNYFTGLEHVHSNVL